MLHEREEEVRMGGAVGTMNGMSHVSGRRGEEERGIIYEEEREGRRRKRKRG